MEFQKLFHELARLNPDIDFSIHSSGSSRFIFIQTESPVPLVLPNDYKYCSPTPEKKYIPPYRFEFKIVKGEEMSNLEL